MHHQKRTGTWHPVLCEGRGHVLSYHLLFRELRTCALHARPKYICGLNCHSLKSRVNKTCCLFSTACTIKYTCLGHIELESTLWQGPRSKSHHKRAVQGGKRSFKCAVPQSLWEPVGYGPTPTE
eukprot:635118-Pelagomonas_calceolata.AAC.2